MNNKEYFLGLDIGTGSVGWAVTDTQYNLIKINRKYAWGSVLFDTAKGAEERRVNRCARRRYQREKQRIKLLQELFEEEIYKVDSGFFHRLNESRYVYADKRDEKGGIPELPYSLFVDENYTDVDYHREFPTVYHLRKALMTEDRAFDVRLLYLAIAHIIRHRGHFLSNMGIDEVNLDFSKVFGDLMNCWKVNMEDESRNPALESEAETIENIEKIMKNSELTKTSKKQKILEELGGFSKEFKELMALITGGKVSLAKLFDKKEYDTLEYNKICFDEASFEENEDFYAANLDDFFEIITKAKAVYDWMILSNIFKDDKSGYLSCAKVADYEKHKKDLKNLKAAIRNDGIGDEEEKRNLYKQTFGIPEKGEANYSKYIGMTASKGSKFVIDGAKCSKYDFYKFVKKNIIPKLKDGELKEYIEKEISLESFMPKTRVKENAIIPYQIHAKELKKILECAEAYMPFLKEQDDSGKTVSEKIMMLLTFRVPYYVGPLNTASSWAWVERNGTGRVTPWNFETMINVDRSAENFIERMTSKCTYLKNEKVLPKSSLVYEEYMVLNELNKLQIKSEPISVELKNDIYHDLFERKLKVTVKKLVDYLKREKGYTDITKEDISGIDIDFKSSLKSYHAFKREFTNVNLSESEKEDIIKDMTLFGAEPKLLKKRLSAKFPGYESQLNSLIKSLNCNGWGRLSYKLLNGIAVEIPGQGMVGTVLYQLRNTNQNLMEILEKNGSSYTKLIEEENKTDDIHEINYELVKELYVSPATKRQIWKSIQVVEEISHAMGHPPKRLFVEMAREHMESKRSVTRKNKLLDLYKSIKDERELYEELKGQPEDKLRSDKLYLYYTQFGTCAYTGKKIELSELFNNNLYDIDHIYPQSKTADDSLDNRVLVCKDTNEYKSDIYPIDSDIQKKMWDTWNVWYSKGLISKEKYKRLTRTSELTNDELTGFINRQLVETRQSTKEFMKLMRQLLPDTELVYSKAGNVSRFRQKYKILKVRELNDYHHARDAYLNIVVGNAYHLRFTKDIRNYFMKYGTYRTYNLKKMFEKDITFQEEVAWRAGERGTIQTVLRFMNCDKVLVTRQTFERKGVLFDVQPKERGEGQVPIKSGINNERLADIEKYGGYNGATISYFILIEGLKNNKNKKRYIIPVPLYLCHKIEKDELYAKLFFEKESKLSNIRIIRKILIQTLMIDEGFKMRLAGKSGTQLIFHNSNELSLNKIHFKCLKEIEKFILDRKDKPDATINEKSELAGNQMLDIYNIFIDKLMNSVYSKELGKHGEFLNNGLEQFNKLSLEDQAIQLHELLKFFQCTPEMPDLSRIGGSKSIGAIRSSMDVTKRSKLAIIHQSVTGIYEKIERINE